MKKIFFFALVALFVSSVTISCKGRHCSAYNTAKIQKVKKDRTEKEI